MSISGRIAGIETALSRIMRVERGLIYERILERVSSIGSQGDETHPSIVEIRNHTRNLLLDSAEVNIEDLEKAVAKLPYEEEKRILQRLIRMLNELSGAEI